MRHWNGQFSLGGKRGKVVREHSAASLSQIQNGFIQHKFREGNSMRYRFTKLLALFVMVFAVCVITIPSKAVDDPCGRNNQVDCINHALDNLQNCMGSDSYCAAQFDRDYVGCMILHGCPDPPPAAMRH